MKKILPSEYVKKFISRISSHSLFIWIIGLVCLGVLTFHTYLRRNEFSFVDEFHNYVSAYFILQGKELYTDIFFNHQPIMAWLSTLLLAITKPTSLYHYVLLHRFAMIAISMCFIGFFLLRMRLIGLLFLLIFEYLKFYLFGFTFQAESIIAYMSAYLFFLIWQKWHDKRVYWFDYVLTTICILFGFWARETLIPLLSVLFSFIFFIQPKRDLKIKVISATFLAIALLVPLFSLDLNAWWYQVVEFNKQTVGASEVGVQNGLGMTLLRAFGYPIYVFFGTNYGHYHMVLLFLVVIGLYSLFVYFRSERKLRSMNSLLLICFSIMLIGGLAAIRPHLPGEEFYGAYRISSWVSIFIMLTILTFEYVKSKNISCQGKIITTLLSVFFLFMYFAPRSYLYKIPSLQPVEQYSISYSPYENYGYGIKALADQNDTLFIDGYDALPYIVSQVKPAFPEIYFFPPQKGVKKFEDARTEMFTQNPPTFYLQDCSAKIKQYNIAQTIMDKYSNIQANGKNSCLFVLKSKLPEIKQAQWTEAERYGWTKAP